MQALLNKLTQASISTEWPKIILLSTLALLFISNSIGLIEFGGDSSLGVQLKLEMMRAVDGSLSFPLVGQSPEFTSLTISSILLALLLPLLRPIVASVLVLALTIPPIYMGLNSPYNNSSIPMQYTLLVLLMLFGINILFSYFTETQKKQNLINVFGRFVPPEIVDQLSKNPELYNLDGDLKHMTVFFSDLVNFSSVAEELNPKQLVSLLNEYFTMMTEILYKHGATIDKYIGDSIMAFWSAPVPQEDHARRAIMASFEMHQAIKELSKKYIARGWPGPLMGVGINSGMMNVGNMGSKYRIAYTVIGDDVNLASRIQNLTREYHVPTIVGKKTVNNIEDVVFRELDTVTVKGKHFETRIYQPLCMNDQLTDELKAKLAYHNKALQKYYANDFEEATKLFRELFDDSNNDQYYKHMLDKISWRNQDKN